MKNENRLNVSKKVLIISGIMADATERDESFLLYGMYMCITSCS